MSKTKTNLESDDLSLEIYAYRDLIKTKDDEIKALKKELSQEKESAKDRLEWLENLVFKLFDRREY